MNAKLENGKFEIKKVVRKKRTNAVDERVTYLLLILKKSGMHKFESEFMYLATSSKKDIPKIISDLNFCLENLSFCCCDGSSLTIKKRKSAFNFIKEFQKNVRR